MLVVDASVVAPVVTDAGVDGKTLRARLRGESIAAPDLLRVEVMSVIRKYTLAGAMTVTAARGAIDDLLDLPLAVFPTAPLLRRGWALRGNLTAHEACYAALAEALDCPLLTADTRLANAPGTRCAIEVV